MNESSSDLDSSSGDLPYLPRDTEKKKKLSFENIIREMKDVFPHRRTKSLELDGTDSVAIIFLTAIGMITRIFRIQYPAYVVFDEVYFGNFTNYYLKGTYFHDIHPPLAKLIMAGVAYYAGYKGDYQFEAYGEDKKYPSMTYVSLRMTPAFFGALCVPLSYFIMRAMLCSHFSSFVAALLVASDVMLVVEARHILSDGILHFFCCLAIFSIFLFERASNIYSLIFEGVCLGCAAACKYTSGGIVLLAIIRQFQIYEIPNFVKRVRGAIIRSGILCSLVAIIHFICFSIHLTLLPFKPTDDIGMPDCVRKGLVDRLSPDWDARSRAPSMLKRVVSLALYMHFGNMAIGGGHAYSSPWYSWPLATSRWVLYWTLEGKHILCMANVLLWYPVFFAVIGNIVRVLLKGDFTSELASMLFGYLLSYLPFLLIPREMFIYHYAIPLLFGCYNIAVLIDREMTPKIRGFMYCSVTAMAIFGFFLWAPWAYGLTTPDFDFLVWNNAWRG